MPVQSDTELFSRLKQGELAPVYLLYGEEHYFSEQAAARIQSLAVSPGFESFNFQRFEGEKLDFSELEDACDALPMMAERKCVLVKDLDLEKLNKPELDRLLALVQEPNPSTVLILLQVSAAINPKKSAKSRKISEAAEKSGVVCAFSFKDKTTLKRALSERARKAYIRMELPVAEALIERCSSDYTLLVQELDKLIAYVGEGEITEADVDECCVRSIDASAFDLAKAVLNRNFDLAFQLLDELFFLRQEAMMILGALSMAFGDLYRAKCAQAAGRTPEQMSVDVRYPKNRQFAVKNAFRDVRKLDSAQFRLCLSALYEADRLLKSSRLDDRLILEQMLGKMRAAE